MYYLLIVGLLVQFGACRFERETVYDYWQKAEITYYPELIGLIYVQDLALLKEVKAKYGLVDLSSKFGAEFTVLYAESDSVRRLAAHELLPSSPGMFIEALSELRSGPHYGVLERTLTVELHAGIGNPDSLIRAISRGYVEEIHDGVAHGHYVVWYTIDAWAQLPKIYQEFREHGLVKNVHLSRDHPVDVMSPTVR